jgi:hypothetical protein
VQQLLLLLAAAAAAQVAALAVLHQLVVFLLSAAVRRLQLPSTARKTCRRTLGKQMQQNVIVAKESRLPCFYSG